MGNVSHSFSKGFEIWPDLNISFFNSHRYKMHL